MDSFKIGFIGLGLMGTPMAKNVQKAGFNLSVYNRNPEKTKEFSELGVQVASSPLELAKQVDVVITMVTGPEDVKEVLLGESGVVYGAKAGLVVIDMSTIGPQTAKEIAQELAKGQVEFLDAPVTGSTPKAITGELTIFVGGKEEMFLRVKPVLHAMGTNLIYMGGVGSGQAIKLVNNQLIASTLAALSESMILAESLGLKRQQVLRALDQAPVFSPFLRLKAPLLIKGEYPTLFSLKNMDKDLRLAQMELVKSNKKLPILDRVAQLHVKGLELGFGEEDNSAIMKVLEEENNK